MKVSDVTKVNECVIKLIARCQIGKIGYDSRGKERECYQSISAFRLVDVCQIRSPLSYTGFRVDFLRKFVPRN